MSEFESQQFLANAPSLPGVYQFFDEKNELLYVGKARNLKKRLQSYFCNTGLTPKTQLMVSKIASAQVQTTHNESEALLLENQLIKAKKPRYNIALRDDKSYPYIRLDESATYPRFTFYRGQRKDKALYFGPYANAAAVRSMLTQLSKIFLLRQCNDSVFSNRSRPCLQYQIKRCSAPCVDYISPAHYRDDVEQAKAMLNGEDERLIQDLNNRMEAASGNLEFEQAAQYRDRIALLQRIRETQYVATGSQNVDIVALAKESQWVCFAVMSVRQGQNLGLHYFVQTDPMDMTLMELMQAFLPQYYLDRKIPDEIVLSEAIDEKQVLQHVFSEQVKHKVKIKQHCRSQRARWIDSALSNARDHLNQHINQRSQIRQQFEALASYLQLAEIPQRIECFDISHTMGERPVASCVVFDESGPRKMDYRRFNITHQKPGDDYAAMRQALSRRYQKLVETDAILPDLIIVDGGKGQLNVAKSVLQELQLLDSITLLGVSKGPERIAGEEEFHLINPARRLKPKGSSMQSHLVQQIRDEAHRFAITGHRQARAKARTHSILQDIPEVGASRRRALLQNFGGIQEIKRASIEDMAKVDGISRRLAQKIYEFIHN